jgi:hypothetical protein
VGSFLAGASPYGVLDMAGNVWEWVAEWYDESRGTKVLRGGSWDYAQSYARLDSRRWNYPIKRYSDLGFRCVLSSALVVEDSLQFTGAVVWDPVIAPNCGGPAISKESIAIDSNGNPLDGLRIEIDCYGNKWLSHPSGNPGEYEPGHYDFSFGQESPQDWECRVRAFDLDGEPVASSQTIEIEFNSNDCTPGGTGHQVAIVNWTKHW